MGVDFMGPLKVIKDPSGGKEKLGKYVCVFTCAVTRAVHLELVEDIGFEQLELAFQRFMSIRNVVPKVVYSDAAPQFKAAATSVLSFAVGVQLQDKMSGHTQWKINASRAPWWGGFYERFMGMIRNTLARAFYAHTFPTAVHLQTALTVVMKIMNARPLTTVGDTDLGIDPITPQSFLTPCAQRSDLKHAEWAFNHVQSRRVLAKFLRQKRLNQSRFYATLWHSFVQNYVMNLRMWHSLKNQEKRLKPGRHVPQTADELVPGTIVLLSGENDGMKGPNKLARMHWRRGIVTKVHRGARDGLVRCVDLETMTSTGTRVTLTRWPVQRITPLEVPSDDGDSAEAEEDATESPPAKRPKNYK
jgi:hypothetical protein